MIADIASARCAACRRRHHDRSKNHTGDGRRGLSRLASVRAPARRTGTTSSASTISSPGTSRTSSTCSAIRASSCAPRRDVPALRRGRRDLQSRLPRLAHPLPARSRADDQDQRARRHQHAGSCQAPEVPHLPGVDLGGLRRSHRCIRNAEDYWGNVNPIGPRSCYDEGKRCAETLFFDYHRQHELEIKVARIFNTYGPRMHPDDGRVVSNFIVQALTGEPITIYGDGSQTRSFCYVDDLIDGLRAPDGFSPTDLTGPINLGNPDEFTIRELAELVIDMTGSKSKLNLLAAAAGRSQAAPARHRAGQQASRLAPDGPLREGLGRTIGYFDRLLRPQTRCGCRPNFSLRDSTGPGPRTRPNSLCKKGGAPRPRGLGRRPPRLRSISRPWSPRNLARRRYPMLSSTQILIRNFATRRHPIQTFPRELIDPLRPIYDRHVSWLFRGYRGTRTSLRNYITGQDDLDMAPGSRYPRVKRAPPLQCRDGRGRGRGGAVLYRACGPSSSLREAAPIPLRHRARGSAVGSCR